MKKARYKKTVVEIIDLIDTVDWCGIKGTEELPILTVIGAVNQEDNQMIELVYMLDKNNVTGGRCTKVMTIPKMAVIKRTRLWKIIT
jgi:hypothetical protein